MNKSVFTTDEAAVELGVSSARVRQLILDGTLKTERFGRAHVITREALDQARLRQTSPGPAAKSAPSSEKRATGRLRARNGTSTGRKKGGKK
jgi:excisionase family DNA binding protein